VDAGSQAAFVAIRPIIEQAAQAEAR